MMNTAATMPMITKTPDNTPPTIAASELLASASAVVYIIKRQKKIHHAYSSFYCDCFL